MRSRLSAVSLTVLAFACALPAAAQSVAAPPVAPLPVAQTNGANQVVSYQPDYFTPFQVSSALDMVFHVPGFSFSSGDNSVRGFAGAAGNVLIDGERPASKSGLADSLSQISSAQIERVDLITGGSPGIDMQGYRQIVNLIRKKDAKPSIVFGGNYKFFPHNGKPVGFLSYGSNRNGKSTDFYAEAFGFQDNGTNSTKRLIYLPSLSDTSPDNMFIRQLADGTGWDAKLTHARPFAGGKLSVNGNYNVINYVYDADYIQPADTAVEHLFQNEISSEMGMQYERKLTKTLTLDINLLRRHDRVHTDDVYTDAGNVGHYWALAVSDEHIISGKMTWQPNDKLTYKMGAESTFNGRANLSSYTQNNAAQNAPFDKVRVEEDRNEYYVIRNWQATPKLNIEAGLKVETSTIAVKQDNRSQSFVYPKPSLQIVWSPTKKLKASWRTERVVGQLNFDDFASSVSLDTTVIRAGNPSVVPQKEWQNSLSLDYTFWDKGAFNVTFKRADLEDTLDFAPITTTSGVFNSRGNIGAGKRDAIATSITLPMDKFHIPGGELKIDYERINSSVTDPITHKLRPISGLNPDNYSIVFNQNFPKMRTSWGIEIDSLNNATTYTATEQYRNKSADWMSLYAEYKTKDKVTFGIVLQNPLRRRDENDRTVWAGLRDVTAQTRYEHNVAYGRPFVILRIKKEM